MRCNLCSLVLQNLDNFIYHLKAAHSNEPLFICINKKCQRTFFNVSQLYEHITNCILHNFTDELINVPVKNCSRVASLHTMQEHQSIKKKHNGGKIIKNDKKTDDNFFKTRATQFIGKLYNSKCITRSAVQNIIVDFSELLQLITSHTGEKLKNSIPIQFHSNIDKCLNFNGFEGFETEHKRFKFFKGNHLLIKPESFYIGGIDDDRNVDGKIILTKKKCYGQIISIKNVLFHYFQLPYVFEKITKYIKVESSKTSSVYSSLCQGKVGKNIMKSYENKIVTPLYLYYDDFEVCNPLSTAAGIYKIGGLYFSIAALSPEFSSSVSSIFLARLLYTSDLKTFGNEKCFSNIIEQLTDLANTEVSIIIDGDTKHLFFVTVGILGDILGVNSIFGYSKSFVATYFCRFCQASKTECYQQNKEDVKLLRNCENYAEDVKNLSHGVKKSCVFDNLPFFQNVVNATCDVMHDFSQGVCRYDMAKIIKNFIDKKYFTLEQLNDRLKYFDHSKFDHGNKVSTMSKSHIQNSCIIITAAEMSCLVTYFGIIISDLVPFDDSVWDLSLCLYDIYDIVMSSTISKSEIIHLEQLIKMHNQLYIEFFSENLKLKHHLILHIPSIIKNMGPSNDFSCAKYESFHKLSKAHSEFAC